MEFYAGTTHRVILANVDRTKPGALGRPLPGSDPVAIARVDLAAKAVVRDGTGIVFAARGEPGVLAVRTDGWVTTADVVQRDDDGDYWFVDALSGYVGGVSTRGIEDRFYEDLDVEIAAAYGVGDDVWVAYVGGAPIDRVAAMLEGRGQPRVVVRLDEIPLTEGFRAKKSGLPRALSDDRIREHWPAESPSLRSR